MLASTGVRFSIFAAALVISFIVFRISFRTHSELPRVTADSDFSSDISQLTNLQGVSSLIHQCCHHHLLATETINATLLQKCVSENFLFTRYQFDVYGYRASQRRFLTFTEGFASHRDCVSLSIGSAGGKGIVEDDLRRRHPYCRVFVLKSNFARQDLISKVALVVPFIFEQNENSSETEPTIIGPILRKYVKSDLVHFANVHSFKDWLRQAITHQYFQEGDVICQIAFQIFNKDVDLLRNLLEFSRYTPIFVKAVGVNAVLVTVAHLEEPRCDDAFGFSRHVIVKELPSSINAIQDFSKPTDMKWDPDLFLSDVI